MIQGVPKPTKFAGLKKKKKKKKKDREGGCKNEMSKIRSFNSLFKYYTERKFYFSFLFSSFPSYQAHITLSYFLTQVIVLMIYTNFPVTKHIPNTIWSKLLGVESEYYSNLLCELRSLIFRDKI
jgi:hypothetical protein